MKSAIGNILRVGLILGAVGSLCLPSSAVATYDPIGHGAVRLSFDKRFLSLLKQNGVKLGTKAGARLKGKALTLPVSGGKVDPKAALTTTETAGTLVFRKGNRSLPLRRIEFKANRNPLQAKVGGGQLKVAITAKKPSEARVGFGMRFSAKGLRLTAKVATRLNKKLRLRGVFQEGQPLGTLKTEVSPLTSVILPRGRATLVPDAAMLAKLEDLFVSLNPIAPAELAPGPVLSFPIIPGGRLAPDVSQGTLRTGGAIELLQLSGGQVFEREFWLDFGLDTATSEPDVQPSPPYPGKQGRIGALAIEMAAASVSSNPKARTITVSGAPLTLTAATAAAFNEAFAGGKPHFAAGERFGIVSFAAQGQ